MYTIHYQHGQPHTEQLGSLRDGAHGTAEGDVAFNDFRDAYVYRDGAWRLVPGTTCPRCHRSNRTNLAG